MMAVVVLFNLMMRRKLLITPSTEAKALPLLAEASENWDMYLN